MWPCLGYSLGFIQLITQQYLYLYFNYLYLITKIIMHQWCSYRGIKGAIALLIGRTLN